MEHEEQPVEIDVRDVAELHVRGDRPGAVTPGAPALSPGLAASGVSYRTDRSTVAFDCFPPGSRTIAVRILYREDLTREELAANLRHAADSLEREPPLPLPSEPPETWPEGRQVEMRLTIESDSSKAPGLNQADQENQ